MLPQMDPTWFASQSFWLLITFCAMLVIVRVCVMPLMRATVDLRQARLDEDIEATEKLKAKAETIIKEYDARIAEARKETQDILARAQQESQALLTVSEQAFNDRLNARIADSEKQLDRIRAEALDNVKRIAADITGAMAEKIAGVTLLPDEISASVAEAAKKEKQE